MNAFAVEGNVIDLKNKKIFRGTVFVENGSIRNIEERSPVADPSLPYISPGFIDAHVHIESSMLVPSEFARLAVVHGTVATVSDPHEIANVCGIEGVRYMMDNSRAVPFRFYFGAPSCVPATTFETAGAVLDPADVEELLRMPEIKYLSEMMNFPGVINNDPGVLMKIGTSLRLHKPVDGHAPALRGEALIKYVAAGISTDHECFTADEALEKLNLGVKILIREGSAAKNFDALIPLMHDHWENMMFCSDDKHPDSLVRGHINTLCSRAAKEGIDIFKILTAACLNPVKHYGLEVGSLQPGDTADFILVKDLIHFRIIKTFIGGNCVAENGKTLINSVPSSSINHFSCNNISVEQLEAHKNRYLINELLPVIEALDGQLITRKLMLQPLIKNNLVISDPANDVLKIVVVNRYQNSVPAISFIKNFNLSHGAIASSVAHDSHNIIAVGVDDESICRAVNLIIEQSGGVSCITPGDEMILPLPVAGLMSAEDGYTVASAYTAIDQMSKALGSRLSAPFMTLSFMALLVIPSLKLSDLGLFDGDRFQFAYPS